MSYLGSRRAEGALSADNPYFAGGWAVAFTPAVHAIREPFEVFHIAVQGPALPSCNLQVWLDTSFYSATVRGDINDYDPNQAIPVAPGQTLFLYWDTTTGPRPVVSIYCRQPSPL
jgi:hypothetical protein